MSGNLDLHTADEFPLGFTKETLAGLLEVYTNKLRSQLNIDLSLVDLESSLGQTLKSIRETIQLDLVSLDMTSQNVDELFSLLNTIHQELMDSGDRPWDSREHMWEVYQRNKSNLHPTLLRFMENGMSQRWGYRFVQTIMAAGIELKDIP